MAIRAFGSATVSFGLVSIPVKIYTTRRTESSLSFHLLHDTCGSRLNQQYVCPEHGEVVPREHITKGYELARGRHVPLSSDELASVRPASDYAIALAEFVPAASVDPVYLESAYYLAPARGGDRAYGLLGHALRRTGLVGVARHASRGKEQVVLIRPYEDDGLIMHPLRYRDEVRPFADVPRRPGAPVDEAELDMAIRIIEQAAGDSFRPERYVDEVKERVLALVKEKAAPEDTPAHPARDPAHDPAHDEERLELTSALEASLGLTGLGNAALHHG